MSNSNVTTYLITKMVVRLTRLRSSYTSLGGKPPGTLKKITLEQKSLHLPGVQLAEKSNRNVFLTGVISIEGVMVKCRFINTFIKHLPQTASRLTPQK